MTKKLVIGDVHIANNERKRIYLKASKLYDFTEINIPVEVIRGDEEGPVLFVSAAIHGDEINGVEIIRRLLGREELNNLKGTLIAVPIVNVYGFNSNSRYLPDRRDLNRSFPGSSRGSQASQLANTFMTEIVKKCTHGIDLHTAAVKRSNYPHIRANLKDSETEKMAQAFNSPIILNTPLPHGSLREAAKKIGIPIILFEGGEALTFNEEVIKPGVEGVLSVMASIGMMEKDRQSIPVNKVPTSHSSHWMRAPHSGILLKKVELGERVKRGQLLGVISDPFGRDLHNIKARKAGIIVGAATMPLLNKGEAIFHVAELR
ncbi:MAG: succinylglutamate desuccinylase [Alphaproteobacteria bacterium]|nr:succinylglutamate desuccinylase [Alphaproteobacteria bacterium]